MRAGADGDDQGGVQVVHGGQAPRGPHQVPVRPPGPLSMPLPNPDVSPRRVCASATPVLQIRLSVWITDVVDGGVGLGCVCARGQAVLAACVDSKQELDELREQVFPHPLGVLYAGTLERSRQHTSTNGLALTWVRCRWASAASTSPPSSSRPPEGPCGTPLILPVVASPFLLRGVACRLRVALVRG